MVIEKVTTTINLRDFHLLGPVPLLGQSPVYCKSTLCYTIPAIAVNQKWREEDCGVSLVRGLASRKWTVDTAATAPLGRVRKPVEGNFPYGAFESDFSQPVSPTHLL